MYTFCLRERVVNVIHCGEETTRRNLAIATDQIQHMYLCALLGATKIPAKQAGRYDPSVSEKEICGFPW